jgi:hypothetical protein
MMALGGVFEPGFPAAGVTLRPTDWFSVAPRVEELQRPSRPNQRPLSVVASQQGDHPMMFLLMVR